MEMFFSVLALSLVGVGVSALLFVAATRQGPLPEPELKQRVIKVPSRFFGDEHGEPAPALAVSFLALQIERHVRLELAAAELFRGWPSVEALHAPTTSPLTN